MGDLLIDGGPPETADALRTHIERAVKSRGGRLHIDLVVVTHIDNDHIGGILPLLTRLPEGVSVGGVWYNGYRHLLPASLLGVTEGETLSSLLDRPGAPDWNAAFGNKAVVVPETGDLPEVKLPGGMVLTLLSPTPEKLAKLAPVWEREARKAGLFSDAVRPPDPDDLLGRRDRWPPDLDALVKGSFSGDGSETNGSGIAFIGHCEGRSCLFGADAHAEVICRSLERLGAPVAVDAFKLPHHGSAANLSKALLERVRCPRFLISTNGARFYHPDYAALARVLKFGGEKPTLFFNYRSSTTESWEKLPELPRAPAATVDLPRADTEGAVVDL